MGMATCIMAITITVCIMVTGRTMAIMATTGIMDMAGIVDWVLPFSFYPQKQDFMAQSKNALAY